VVLPNCWRCSNNGSSGRLIFGYKLKDFGLPSYWLRLNTTTIIILGDNPQINRGGHRRVPPLLMEGAREKRLPLLIINGGGNILKRPPPLMLH
jgi:hypothetical protein